MSDEYGYTNGEEVMNGIDSEFSEAADLAYEKIDRHLSDEPITWDSLCEEYFGMDVPDKQDKPYWTLHVMARAAMMAAVNHRARIYQRPWQLFIEKQGVSVVKLSKTDMVGRVVHDRMKKVAQACKLITTRLTPLSTNMEITSKDRKVVRQMLDVSRGSQMAIAGMVDRLDSVRKSEKNNLLQLFEIDYTDDE